MSPGWMGQASALVASAAKRRVAVAVDDSDLGTTLLFGAVGVVVAFAVLGGRRGAVAG